jgi:hypothetical protein
MSLKMGVFGAFAKASSLTGMEGREGVSGAYRDNGKNKIRTFY